MPNKKLSSEQYLKYLLNKRMALSGLLSDTIISNDEEVMIVLHNEIDKNEAMIDKVMAFLAMEVVVNG